MEKTTCQRPVYLSGLLSCQTERGCSTPHSGLLKNIPSQGVWCPCCRIDLWCRKTWSCLHKAGLLSSSGPDTIRKIIGQRPVNLGDCFPAKRRGMRSDLLKHILSQGGWCLWCRIKVFFTRQGKNCLYFLS